MDWHDSVFALIDMRSFGNIWYWIMLATVWSATGQRVLGVPWDMVLRARRQPDGAAMADFTRMIRINVDRRLRIFRQAGLVLAGLAAFALTSLSLLAVVYGNEFAQALLLLVAPLMLVAAITLRTARAIRVGDLAGPALVGAVQRLRLVIQVIAMVSIFVTAIWGMYQNISADALG